MVSVINSYLIQEETRLRELVKLTQPTELPALRQPER